MVLSCENIHLLNFTLVISSPSILNKPANVRDAELSEKIHRSNVINNDSSFSFSVSNNICSLPAF